MYHSGPLGLSSFSSLLLLLLQQVVLLLLLLSITSELCKSFTYLLTYLLTTV